MSHPQVMFMLRLLAAASWSDGELAQSESASIERLINAADLDDEERATARGWLSAPISLDDVDVAGLSDNQRLATYQAAVRIVFSDNEVADAERVFLDRVRDALGISAEQGLEIEADIPRHD